MARGAPRRRALTVSEPFAVEVVRSDMVESVHRIDVAVTRGGRIEATAGDATRVAFWRSSLKPVQTAVSLETGWRPAGEDEIAVASGSHDASPLHLEVVRRILASAGLDEEALRCPPALPLSEAEAARAGAPRRILHNCSGKHAAFLAACVAAGLPVEGYLDPDHALQRAIVERAAALCGGDWSSGTDGCGAVTPGAPLTRIASAFASNAAAEPAVANAMRAHPILVGGDGRIDTELMAAVDGLVAKGGAEGLLCFAHLPSGTGGAMKCRDGASRAIAPVAVAVLAELGLLEAGMLPRHAHPAVLGGGRPVGSLIVSGRLSPAAE